jgi:hypothetical protein
MVRAARHLRGHRSAASHTRVHCGHLQTKKVLPVNPALGRSKSADLGLKSLI